MLGNVNKARRFNVREKIRESGQEKGEVEQKGFETLQNMVDS